MLRIFVFVIALVALGMLTGCLRTWAESGEPYTYQDYRAQQREDAFNHNMMESLKAGVDEKGEFYTPNYVPIP